MIRGAIFDADGTLLDSMAMWDGAGERYLRSLGITPLPGLRDALFPRSLAESIRYMKETYGLTQSPQEVAAGINETMRAFYRTEVKAKAGAREFLTALRQRGVSITLATNTDRALIVEGLLTAGLLPLLDDIFTCGELGVNKHVPDIYDRARDRMGTRTGETWVFEDAVHGARTAFQAGYKVAAVADPFSDQEELKRYCHLYLPDLTDPAGFWAQAEGL